jgi:hypothetical protein
MKAHFLKLTTIILFAAFNANAQWNITEVTPSPEIGNTVYTKVAKTENTFAELFVYLAPSGEIEVMLSSKLIPQTSANANVKLLIKDEKPIKYLCKLDGQRNFFNKYGAVFNREIPTYNYEEFLSNLKRADAIQISVISLDGQKLYAFSINGIGKVIDELLEQKSGDE